jgi:hypothetical protein
MAGKFRDRCREGEATLASVVCKANPGIRPRPRPLVDAHTEMLGTRERTGADLLERAELLANVLHR